jgi:uncharacterized protein (DUF433 family)
MKEAGMISGKSYVTEDSQGAMRIGATGVSLDSIVIAFQRGQSAEIIQQLYPALSLEEVYGAIAFYLANREQVHHYLQGQDALWTELRERAQKSPSQLAQRLRAPRPLSSTVHGR